MPVAAPAEEMSARLKVDDRAPTREDFAGLSNLDFEAILRMIKALFQL
ncbi:MAG: hypothetical protein IPJ48_10015 [Propionivibrio sp.]|uniref:Uncharacterized protein n=1 Tax=Candidatus Propionivibrio dominans TaxID=2954373 RepID=A0A9D7I8R5_9RHOO|nr:hypothetical protein [Candidatus Propionivibrio dominans]